MTYAIEFPDFAPADMPPIPAGFEDVSWRNETCPHFIHEALKLHLFVDFARPEDREFPETKRFSIHPDSEGMPDAHALLVETDDWSEVLAAILAEAFAAVLRRWLSEAEFAAMREANATPNYQGESAPCASHDHCDANMALHEAFVDVVGREPFALNVPGREPPFPGRDAAQEADLDLCNAAWALAKARHLTAPPQGAGQ